MRKVTEAKRAVDADSAKESGSSNTFKRVPFCCWENIRVYWIHEYDSDSLDSPRHRLIFRLSSWSSWRSVRQAGPRTWNYSLSQPPVTFLLLPIHFLRLYVNRQVQRSRIAVRTCCPVIVILPVTEGNVPPQRSIFVI